MSLRINNFKELLLKKSERSNNLNDFISGMNDDLLLDYVVESLEKMAQHIGKQKGPNDALVHYAKNDITDGDMVHDALSHHATRYNAALKSGNDNVADKHMGQIFKIMHMANKITQDGHTNHTSGRLNVSAVDPKPWERNKYTNMKAADPYKQSSYTTDTKGWGYSGNDFSFLRKQPHHSYASEVSVHGHSKAYPLEEIKVNGKYLDIDHDHKGGKQYEPHALDTHPIMGVYGVSKKDFTDKQMQDYLASHGKFHEDAGALDKYYENLPDHPPTRGQQKSKSVHADVEPLDFEQHISKKTPAQQSAKPQVQTQAAQPESAKVSAPVDDDIFIKELGSKYNIDADRAREIISRIRSGK